MTFKLALYLGSWTVEFAQRKVKFGLFILFKGFNYFNLIKKNPKKRFNYCIGSRAVTLLTLVTGLFDCLSNLESFLLLYIISYQSRHLLELTLDQVISSK